MADFSDLMTATRAIVDPTTSGADLAQIAQAQPSLWPQIAAHPNAYPDLLTWLQANGDTATKAVVEARNAAPVVQQPPPPPPPVPPTLSQAQASSLVSANMTTWSISPESWNTKSIVAFVLALIPAVSVAGIVVGHISLSEMRRRPQRGKALSIAALLIGYLLMASLVVSLVFVGAAVHKASVQALGAQLEVTVTDSNLGDGPLVIYFDADVYNPTNQNYSGKILVRAMAYGTDHWQDGQTRDVWISTYQDVKLKPYATVSFSVSGGAAADSVATSLGPVEVYIGSLAQCIYQHQGDVFSGVGDESSCY